jgi:tRNA(Ile)-lysidine synthase TilS/MesJ
MQVFSLPENKHIGVMFSGGADSSILLFLLHQNNIIENRNCKIIPYSVPRRTGTIHHTKNVVDYLKNYFKRELPDTVYVGDPDVHHSKFAMTGIRDALCKYKADLVFCGDTKNPDEPLDTTFVAPFRGKSGIPMIHQPFLNFSKNEIMSIYFENNVEDMLKLTHSCSVEVFGRCNYCYFCKEREWAFSKLGIPDPGTN